MCITTLVVALILTSFAAGSGCPRQCPVPEDRAIACDSNLPCYGSYTCCFPEQRENTTVSCCYGYGPEGTYKCCGRATDPMEIIFIPALVSILSMLLIFIIIKALIYPVDDT